MSRNAKIACLTGAGTAPELMAEAMLALDAVARLHGLSIEESHASFGGVAVARAGQAFPAATRSVVVRTSNEVAAIPELVQLLAKRLPTVRTRQPPRVV